MTALQKNGAVIASGCVSWMEAAPLSKHVESTISEQHEALLRGPSSVSSIDCAIVIPSTSMCTGDAGCFFDGFCAWKMAWVQKGV